MHRGSRSAELGTQAPRSPQGLPQSKRLSNPIFQLHHLRCKTESEKGSLEADGKDCMWTAGRAVIKVVFVPGAGVYMNVNYATAANLLGCRADVWSQDGETDA